MMRVTYGGRPATAYLMTSADRLSVHLDTDPGFGSMLHTRIAPSAVEYVSGPAHELARCADAIRREAHYVTPGPGRERLVSLADRVALLVSESDTADIP